MVAAQGMSLADTQGRPSCCPRNGIGWPIQGPLVMADMKASQIVGFLQGADTFHMEELAAEWEEASKFPGGKRVIIPGAPGFRFGTLGIMLDLLAAFPERQSWLNCPVYVVGQLSNPI